MSNERLMSSIYEAKTVEEADIVFEELLERIENQEINLSSTAVIDSYIRVNSLSTSHRSIIFNYTVLATIPSGFTIRMGYEYPAVTRTGQYYRTKTNYSNNKLHVELTIWQSKAAYDRSETPIF